MIQKRLRTLSTKVNGNFFDIIKIRLIMINNVNICTIYESLIYNAMKILLTIYQNKTKFLGKMSKLRV